MIINRIDEISVQVQSSMVDLKVYRHGEFVGEVAVCVNGTTVSRTGIRYGSKSVLTVIVDILEHMKVSYIDPSGVIKEEWLEVVVTLSKCIQMLLAV